MKIVKSVFFLIAVMFLQSSYAESSPVNTLARIQKKGYLEVSMTSKDQPPFFMTNEKGELIGIDIEIAKGMAKNLNVDVKFNREAKSFDDVIQIVGRGDADVGISKLSYTLERARIVLYSEPYINLRKAILLNRIQYAKIKKERRANNLSELGSQKDFVIGVLAKSSYVNFAHTLFKSATINELNSWKDDVLVDIMNGKITAAFRDELEIKKFLLLEPNANLNVLAIILEDQKDPIQMVIQADDHHFQDWVNGYLSVAKLGLDVDKILRKYKDYLAY